MKTLPSAKKTLGGKRLPAIVLSSFLLTACATGPVTPQGAMDVRTKLTELQSDPQVADHARVELREAEQAVQLAERPLSGSESALAEHRIYMAERQLEIAQAKAQTRLAESDRERLGEERDAARLAARTREADRAQEDARSARRSEEAAAAMSASEAREMQRQIDELQAEATERGLVLTLGDVLFATGSAEIQGGSNQNLEKLVNFLNQYPERQVLIEGHTDNVGSAELNRNLSRQRAESVRRYLENRGVDGRRLSVSGYGFDRPVASNESASGRQQNRRVEVIIENR